ncbi:alpha/beta hydrolase family protein [Solimonas sp. K1W22B-7]|uniref:alpha/beta hydrolase family protein n=1 Tax=Solimonas sp. K1W22B-7 TaxID=2303331 RepID=UPI0013C4B613|nr:alpha/beta fold hydrolase [Solimonas sp. K1W22B-7]
MIKATPLQLRCADGTLLAAREYAGGEAGAVVISAALGVPQGFYAAHAAWLASLGYHVISFDNRGFGDSAKGGPIDLADWGRQDLEALLRHARSINPYHFLVGHSIGCQLPGLAPSSQHLSGAVFVAGTAPNLRYYPWSQRPALALLWYGLVPWFTRGRDSVAQSKLGLGKGPVLPSGAAAGWARWARSHDYLFSPEHGLDLSGYAQVRAPILAWNFADDTYAPKAASEALLRHYPAAAITRRGSEAQGSVGHFGYFREAHRDTLWRATADWLAQQSPNQQERARA